MAGYNGYSMSNNAVSAYGDGEMPKSKWNKKNILETIEQMIDDGLNTQINISEFNKLPSNILKTFLKRSSWHHTSSKFNITDFYKIDEEAVVNLSKEQIEILKKIYKEEKKENKRLVSKVEQWEVVYLIWGGTRKHPKATEYKEIVEYDKSKNYVITSNGKKMTNSNGFNFIKKVGK